MKKSFLHFLLFFICATEVCSQDIFIDYYGNHTGLENNKTKIVVTISTISCHQCYIELHDFFVKQKVFEDKRYNIVALCFLDKNQIKDISIRKRLYQASKGYFPEIEQVYFVSTLSKGRAKFCRKRLDVRNFPNIFVIDQRNKVKFFDDYNKFMNEFEF